MKNIFTIIILVILALAIFQGCGKYNSFVDLDENVDQAWSKVETQYQRRADLIPSLVNTVKGYADFEQQTITQVTEARAKATNMTAELRAEDLTPENLAKFQEAQSQLSGSLARLLMSVERYPDLKANQNFLEQQSQLEGTENRISVARNDFNDAVTAYNKSVRKFPANFYASVFGFEEKANFEADANAQDAPDVQF